MKRGKPLRRKAKLTPDPEKVREFMQRGRQELERAAPKRARRKRPPEGPLTPAEWRQAVFVASEGRCVMTGARARDVEDRRFHAHHPLPKSALRARKLYDWVWDPRNGILLHRGAHERHEYPVERVPAEKLPASVWAFCAELDAIDGTEWATQLVLRRHPARGFRGRTE